MKFVPRVLTDGRAVALGGYVHRVNDSVIRRNLSMPSASASLGGSSESNSGPYSFSQNQADDEVVSFASATMKTWHDRSDSGNGTGGETETVHATSTISRLSVSKRLFLDHASAYLKTVYHAGDAQPTITPVQAQLDGLVIDGVRFTVTLGTEPVARYGTCDQFHHACLHDTSFKASHGNQVQSLREGQPGGPAGKACFVYSLVDRITWEGKLPEGAEVSEDSHVIVWPDFGTVILGEMLISDFSRRLTMMRLELGSPLKASMAITDVESGGVGLP
jgi:hypothetical protein